MLQNMNGFQDNYETSWHIHCLNKIVEDVNIALYFTLITWE